MSTPEPTLRRPLRRTLAGRPAVVLVGALLTLGAAALADVAPRGDAVYYTRGEVTFLAPASRTYPNALSTTSESLIIAAGAIGKQISGPTRPTKLADPSVDLVGLGVRDGWSVRLPDTGGQWATNFPDQQLVVEVVGPDAAVVAARERALVDRIRGDLDDFQRAAGVDPVNEVSVRLTPDASGVDRVEGDRVRALGMTLVLGTAATALVASRRPRRPAARAHGRAERRGRGHGHR